jgi:hypothetical protein
MGINHHRLGALEKRAREVVTARAVREAKRIVGIWNARHAANRDLWFYPTIGCCDCRRMSLAAVLLSSLSANW